MIKMTIGIVYFSNTDITGKLVRETANVIEESGMSVFVYHIDGTEIIEGRFNKAIVFDQLEKCSAIIFASPTYMGGPAAQFKAFADATSPIYSNQGWNGKLAAGITSGSGLNGDQSSTLQYFVTLASQHGMSWLGLSSITSTNTELKINRLGCQLGVVAHSETTLVNANDLQTAKHLGKRIVNHLLQKNDVKKLT